LTGVFTAGHSIREPGPSEISGASANLSTK
jgi:hypothetical protein